MRRGMTLIELLVVIAVIAVLVGLTYTALLQAQKRGYLTVCIGNLRQLTLAVHAYENDWGMVPIEYIHKTPEGTYGFVQQIIYPYVRDDNIFLCPEDYSKGEKIPMFSTIWKGEKWPMSYYYFINELTVEDYNITHSFPEMVLFCCTWHVNGNITIVARYDGRIEIVPKGRYKRISVITED